MERKLKNKKLINEFFKTYQPKLKNWYHDSEIITMTSFLNTWNLSVEDIENFIDCKVDISKRKKYYNVNGFPEYYFTSLLYFLNHRDFYTFERLKKVIFNYIKVSKDCREVEKEYPSVDDSYLSCETGYSLIGKFAKLMSEKERLEIEDIIENNIDEFIGYEEYNYRWETQPNNNMIFVPLQCEFPFSLEFIKRNKQYFSILSLKENTIMKNGNMDYHFLLFGDVLEDELNRHLKLITRGMVKDEIKITEELRDGLILKFNLD